MGLDELIELLSDSGAASPSDEQPQLTPLHVFLWTLHSSSLVNFSMYKECAMEMLRLIQFLDPWQIPADVGALNVEGRKVAVGRGA